MNKQRKFDKDGNLKSRGIEWTDNTANPIAGCPHACRWKVDGKIAICYAENIAENLAQKAYPEGFNAQYWRPSELDAIRALNKKKPEDNKVFVVSMGDLFAHNIFAKHIEIVLQTLRECTNLTFQLLTKNPKRIVNEFNDQFADNIWVGVSSAPDFMHGKELSYHQQRTWMHKAMEQLAQVNVPIRWMSFEPLSWDMYTIIRDYPGVLKWSVIGAATNGRTVYDPNIDDVRNLLTVLDDQQVPVFYKSNLKRLAQKHDLVWREEFPETTNRPTQQKLI